MRAPLTLFVLLAAAPVLAQDKSTSSATSTAQQTSATTEAAAAKKAPRKVIRLDALTVEGRIQKPQAFYILPRSNLSFDELNRTESFVPKVEKSVEQEPF
ncbi:hypothetical protein OWM54_09260 [Myxococcus sp. MISCRS1]|jgi:hypothetical protein|uniref:Uncharacterized protein n=1 Tax=Myxococcus fulvus TaxID=33 RepID=A0A511TES3_MYXFU|nr:MULTISPECIES: hypothetical protein [Myxococcus]BDT32662.1 hypothetical protein MFMH1_23310 [Myxococcus sp. MH1]MBZ4400578.1 hypothetical protein [Myxococcus sp. AS-1-15]MBZ4412848.1 hypothetical protein [Myxococcus sp. XM-1-1-1]MCK8501317.1 hypothetical protein [Myxococcus fulvus]MCY0997322.1 hypothetical protein [Myxococcus sp. MISCRS1]